jgi:hypothetical protein
MIEQKIYQLISQDPAIKAVVSGRVYGNKLLPQPPIFPAITYFRVSSYRDRTLSGSSGVTRARIQIDVWASKYIDAKNLSELVRLKLDGLVEGEIQDTEDDNDFDFYEEGENLVKAHGVSMDFIFTYDE